MSLTADIILVTLLCEPVLHVSAGVLVFGTGRALFLVTLFLVALYEGPVLKARPYPDCCTAPTTFP